MNWKRCIKKLMVVYRGLQDIQQIRFIYKDFKTNSPRQLNKCCEMHYHQTESLWGEHSLTRMSQEWKGLWAIFLSWCKPTHLQRIQLLVSMQCNTEKPKMQISRTSVTKCLEKNIILEFESQVSGMQTSCSSRLEREYFLNPLCCCCIKCDYLLCFCEWFLMLNMFRQCWPVLDFSSTSHGKVGYMSTQTI